MLLVMVDWLIITTNPGGKSDYASLVESTEHKYEVIGQLGSILEIRENAGRP